MSVIRIDNEESVVIEPGSKPSPLEIRRQRVERALQRRMLDHLAAGITTDFAANALSIPARVYSDSLRLEAERRELFMKLPLVAGLSTDLKNPGDIKVFDGAGPSIIITRDGRGVIAAYRNMCTHRGSKLIAASGNFRRIVCPFHAWCFNHDGRLIGQPGKAAFDGIDSQRLGLLRVPAAERYGLIFVKAEVSDTPIDADAFLGSMAPEIEQLRLDEMTSIKRGRLSADGNWKHVLDTYGESYHFTALHPGTLGQTHHSNLMAYDAFGRHWRVANLAKSMGNLAQVPESEWPALDPCVYYIFPNTVIVVGSPQPGMEVMEMFNIYPDSVQATHVDLELYAPARAVTFESRPMLEAGYDLAARIVEFEDYSVSAGACDNLRWAPADFNMVLGRNEVALQGMERSIAEAVGMPFDSVDSAQRHEDHGP